MLFTVDAHAKLIMFFAVAPLIMFSVAIVSFFRTELLGAVCRPHPPPPDSDDIPLSMSTQQIKKMQSYIAPGKSGKN